MANNNSNLKTLLLALGVTALVGCTNTNSKIDYDDDVETPDVMLQDSKGGDSDYGLDKDAASHNQQNKPDMLEQGVEPKANPEAPKKRKPKTSSKPKKTPSKNESALEVDDPLLGEVEPK